MRKVIYRLIPYISFMYIPFSFILADEDENIEDEDM